MKRPEFTIKFYKNLTLPVKRVRQGIGGFLVFFVVIAFIDQIFLRKFTLVIFFAAGFFLGLILFRRSLLTRKDLEMQDHLQKEIKEEKLMEERAKQIEENRASKSTQSSLSTQNYGFIDWKKKFESGKKRLLTQKQEMITLIRKADIFMRAENTLLEAKKLLIKALSMAPDNPEANCKLGLLYLEQNEPNKAEAIFRKLITIREDPLYIRSLALSLSKQEKWEEATHYFEEAISREPRNPEHLIDLAVVYEKLGKRDVSMQCLLKASDLDSKNMELLQTLIDYHVEKGDIQYHLDLLRKMLFLKPFDENIKNQLRMWQSEEKF